MQLSKDFDDFPLCGRYIFNFLNTATLKTRYKKVYDAFAAVCEDAKWADKALEPNNGPLVRIVSLEYCGVFNYQGRPGLSDRVFIKKQVAEGYEGKPTAWLTFEATVLHELVHWARFHGGKPSRFNGDEAGEAFEVKAYNKVTTCGVTILTAKQAKDLGLK